MLRYRSHLRSIFVPPRLPNGESGGGRRTFHVPPTVALALLTALLTLPLGGCGSGDRPTLGKVHGRVTLDGKPLAHVGIVFQPQEVGGRDSSGVTNADGEYVLKYIRDELGAAIGKNKVKISKQRTPDPATETLPLRYNQQTTLTAEVKPGENEIPFDLTSNP